jgi:glycosyltransferase involved in cell wall biosynthesis
LVELARGLFRKGHSVKVVEFYSGGSLEEDLQVAGVPVHSLDKRGRWDVVTFFSRFLRYVKHERPQIVYALLGIPCIVSIFLKIFVRKVKIVWGVRAAHVDLSKYDRLSRYAYRCECLLSHGADLIIANSNAGKKYAIEHGFPPNIEVIPNGVDVERFAPDLSARRAIREAWKVKDHEVLIGFVGRLDPMKDPHTFLAAASLVASKCGNTKFVCVGNGLGSDSSEMRSATKAYRLDNMVIWAGEQNDMPHIYNSLDLLVSSSYGEGFSNAIAEAMACGIPCAVTDVGDSAWIVGETGAIVPPQNPRALAKGILSMVLQNKFLDRTLKESCRKRITDNFTTATFVEGTIAAFDGLLKAR